MTVNLCNYILHRASDLQCLVLTVIHGNVVLISRIASNVENTDTLLA